MERESERNTGQIQAQPAERVVRSREGRFQRATNGSARCRINLLHNMIDIMIIIMISLRGYLLLRQHARRTERGAHEGNATLIKIARLRDRGSP
jgi:hypothetical protein